MATVAKTTADSIDKAVAFFGGAEMPARVWSRKYRLRDKANNYLEDSPLQTFIRLADAVGAPAESSMRQNLIERRFIPAGRILFALGNPYYNATYKNCLTGDTQVMTDDGWRRLADIAAATRGAGPEAGPRVAIRIDGRSLPAFAWSNGVKPVYEVATKEGFTVKATADHKFRLEDESWKTVGELEPGDRLDLTFDERRFEVSETDCAFQQGYSAGLFVGDGTYVGEGFKVANIRLFQQKADLPIRMVAEMFGGKLAAHADHVSYNSAHLASWLTELGIVRGNKTVTDQVMQQSTSFQSGFLRGLFDADGSVIFHHDSKGCVQRAIVLGQSDLEMLRRVQTMLLAFGVKSRIYSNGEAGPRDLGVKGVYDCKAAWTLRISRESFRSFVERIGFSHPEKASAAARAVAYGKFKPEVWSAQVTSVTPAGEAEVFDMSVDEIHAFSAGGLVAHNCYVLGLSGDSLESIIDLRKKMARTYAMGGGVGIDLTPLRPHGAPVNNCFHPDTEFLTETGSMTLRAAYTAGKDVLVYDHTGKQKTASVQKFGRQALYRVVFKPNRRSTHRLSFVATANHRWLLKDGTETTTLRVGDIIRTATAEVDRDGDLFKYGFHHGVFFADGTMRREGKTSFQVRLCGKKTLHLEALRSDPRYVRDYPVKDDSGDVVVVFHRREGDWILGQGLKDLPVGRPANYIAGFIEGWAACDGYDVQDSDGDFFNVDTADGEAANWLIKHAFLAGLTVTGHTVDQRATNYGERNAPLHRIRCSRKPADFRVVEITDLGVEDDVYCVVQPDTKSFTLAGGIPTGNCAITSSGSASFADGFSHLTGEIGQNGRRGALMISLSVDHPDVQRFIRAKNDFPPDLAESLREKLPRSIYKRLVEEVIEPRRSCGNSNMSVRVTDRFMKAVKQGRQHITRFVMDDGSMIEEAFDAQKLFHEIVEGAWAHGCPGCIFWDTMFREDNRNYLDERWHIVTTNPCGEQPLSNGGSCNLGSVNLARFTKNPYTDKAEFDWVGFQQAIRDGVRFLDEINTLELNEGRSPLPEQREVTEGLRQIGLGVMGYGDLLLQHQIEYGSDEAFAFTEKLFRTLRDTAYHESVMLAKEKGPFPAFSWEKIKRSPFIQRLPAELQRLIEKHGLRNSNVLSIAPTGSIAIIGETTGGIEPEFAFQFTRAVMMGNGKRTKFTMLSPTARRIARALGKSVPAGEIEGAVDMSWLPKWAVASHQIDPIRRVKLQGLIQQFIDTAISSTVNLPQSATIEDVKQIYWTAYEAGCKGITVYREGSREGILQTLEEQERVEFPIEPPLHATSRRVTFKGEQGHQRILINIADYQPGVPCEVSIVHGKSGTEIASYASAMGILISIALQHGVSPNKIARALEGINAGWVARLPLDGKGAKPTTVTSVPDATAAVLKKFYGNGIYERGVAGLPINDVTNETGWELSASERKVARNCPSCQKQSYIPENGCWTCINPTCGHGSYCG